MRRLPLLLAGVAVFVVALDRWTKHWATVSLSTGEPVRLIGDYVRFTYTRNSGVAFGIGQGTGFPYYVFSLVAIVVILWMFARGRAGDDSVRRLSLALILGGAIGNLVDRVVSGEVVDFIEVGIPQWHWPVFNVADSAVTAGVLLFALAWTRRSEPALAPADGAGEPPHEAVPDETAGPPGPGVERRGASGPLPGGGAEGPLP